MAEIPDRLMQFKTSEHRERFVQELSELPDDRPTAKDGFILGLLGRGAPILARRILYYANYWACLMEDALATGRPLQKIAKGARDDADPTTGAAVTVFMHMFALVRLHDCWVHGEELVRWWNVATLGAQGALLTEAGKVYDASLTSTPDGPARIVAAYRDLQRQGAVP